MPASSFRIRPLSIFDYDAVCVLLRNTPGVQLRDADSRDGIRRYLSRNPGMSFVAEASGELVGCVFGGHDGRRGYLYHLAVSPAYRRQRIGTDLVGRALAAIAKDGIVKVHIDVFASNEESLRFWKAAGWDERNELKRLSFIGSGKANS